MCNILIVEDNSINQRVLDTYLTMKGIKTYIAKNGLEAIRFFKERKFDCILMDIAMPEMDGITAAKHIHKIEYIILIRSLVPNYFINFANTSIR